MIGQPTSSPNAVTSSAVVARAQRGQAIPRAVRRSRIASLSWAKLQGGAGRVDGDAVGLERLEDGRRHVLVVEGDDVAVLGEGAHRLEVGVLADGRARHDEGGGGGVALGEHRQLDAELDGRALHHAGELSAADDADDGESSGGALRLAHDAQA